MESVSDELIVAFTDLIQVIKRLSASGSEERAASWLRFNALRALGCNKPLSLNELASQLDGSISSTAQLVDRLMRDGLVRREENMSDRRRVDLTRTEQGNEECRRLKREMNEKLQHLFEPLTPLERQELTIILTKLTQSHS